MTAPTGNYDGGTLEDLVRSIVQESEESAAAYLRQRWLSAAIAALWKARQDAGLTQADVAARLGTTQSAVARLENDLDGGISLHRFIDYALACGGLPSDLKIESLTEARDRYAAPVGV